jgi:hypothetical protein
MDPDTYLDSVLASQRLASDSDELKALQKHRKDVEALLRSVFEDCSPTIRYGGSQAKGTLIKEAYDLDIICYFPHEDTAAGTTLEEIYSNVRDALSKEYTVEPKPSALRLKDSDPQNAHPDFHVDVVPGRFINESKTDAFLYRSSAEKCRLKTNLEVHIQHVRDSGVTDTIRLLKLWRVRNNLFVKHFVLELLAVKLLSRHKSKGRSDQLLLYWETLRDSSDSLTVDDPANPSGNDLSELFDSAVRLHLSSAASLTLSTINNQGWEAVFGSTDTAVAKQTVTPGTFAAKSRDSGEQFLSDLGIPERLRHRIKMNAEVRQDGFRPFKLRALSSLLRKKRKLVFFLESTDVPEPFDLKWKVKNTGGEAQLAKDLRGEITDDSGYRRKTETTKYTGAHYVECYAIKNGVCVAKDRLDVPIANLS